MSFEGRPISKNDLFGDIVEQGKGTYTIAGKEYFTKQDVRGNQVKTQLGWGGVKRVKP